MTERVAEQGGALLPIIWICSCFERIDTGPASDQNIDVIHDHAIGQGHHVISTERGLSRIWGWGPRW